MTNVRADVNCSTEYPSVASVVSVIAETLNGVTGGCRMGTDPLNSVVDAEGRAHDHENLWVAGAPTQPTASCCNGTLTFAAVGLRTAAAIVSR